MDEKRNAGSLRLKSQKKKVEPTPTQAISSFVRSTPEPEPPPAPHSTTYKLLTDTALDAAEFIAGIATPEPERESAEQEPTPTPTPTERGTQWQFNKLLKQYCEALKQRRPNAQCLRKRLENFQVVAGEIEIGQLRREKRLAEQAEQERQAERERQLQLQLQNEMPRWEFVALVRSLGTPKPKQEQEPNDIAAAILAL